MTTLRDGLKSGLFCIGTLAVFGAGVFYAGGFKEGDSGDSYKLEVQLEKKYGRGFVMERSYRKARGNVIGASFVDVGNRRTDTVYFDAAYNKKTGKLVDTYLSKRANRTLQEKLDPWVGGLLAGRSYYFDARVRDELPSGTRVADVLDYEKFSVEAERKSDLYVDGNFKSVEEARDMLKKLAKMLKGDVLEYGTIRVVAPNENNDLLDHLELTLDLADVEKGFTSEEFNRSYEIIDTRKTK